jgi:hypothetical protein
MIVQGPYPVSMRNHSLDLDPVKNFPFSEILVDYIFAHKSAISFACPEKSLQCKSFKYLSSRN